LGIMGEGRMRYVLAVALAVVACGREQGARIEPALAQVGSSADPQATPDPLIGSWTNPDYPSRPFDGSVYTCDFFPNRMWNYRCGLIGFATTWDRIADNRYVLGSTNGSCLAETTFSSDNDSVALAVRCGTTNTTTYNLVRFSH
jgi:hypothetical protein